MQNCQLRMVDGCIVYQGSQAIFAVHIIEIINNTRGGIEFKNWERS
jgi:hypothetical protein